MKTKLFATLLALAPMPAQAATFSFDLQAGTFFSQTFTVVGDLSGSVGFSLGANAFIPSTGGWQVNVSIFNEAGAPVDALVAALACVQESFQRTCLGFNDGFSSLALADLGRSFTVSGSALLTDVTNFSGRLSVMAPDSVTAVPAPAAGAGFLPLLGLLVWTLRRRA